MGGLGPSGQGDVLSRLRGAWGFQQPQGAPAGLPPELVNAFANYLQQPTGDQRTNAATLAMQGDTSNIPGFDVLNAAGPIFSRNLSDSLSKTNNQGARFSSTNDAQNRLLKQQGLQDFNLFAQQVLEAGRQRQLQGILGYAQAQQGQQGLNLQGQGLQLQGQQLQLQALLPLLQALFGGGLSPGVTVGPSPLSQLASLGGTAATLATAGAFGGGGGKVPSSIPISWPQDTPWLPKP